jgi:hypothetical protein
MQPVDISPEAQQWLRIATTIAVIISVLCLIVFFFGKGGVKLPPDSGFSLSVNGHRVSDSVKLRPGSYQIVARSARYTSVHTKVFVWPFITTTLATSQTERTPESIVQSALGSYGFYGPPSITDTRWFENDTILAGTVGPGSATIIALQYKDGRWQPAYFEATGYPKDESVLPANVRAYLDGLKAENSQQ